MKKIKIAFIGFGHKLGGIETFTINYAKKLKKKGMDIYFINVFENIENESYYKEFKNIGTVIKMTDYRKHPLTFFKEFKSIQKNVKFDILHYNMASAVYLMPLIAAKLNNVRTIISHSHNDASDKGFVKSIIHHFNKRFIPLLANLYLGCSKNAASWFFSRKVLNSTNYHQINNAIELEKFSFDNNKRIEFRKKLNINDDTKVYGHIGSFRDIKNHTFLIDIFYEIQKEQPNSFLILIGKGELMSSIEEKAKLLNIYDKIRILGQVENTYDYLQCMDCFIMPSKHEGLGIVLIEAQASGLTCFASDGIPQEALINPNCYQISLEKSPKYWANQILKENFFRYETTNNLSQYDIDNCSDALYNIYINSLKIKICHFLYGIKNGGVEKVLINYFSNIDKSMYDLHIISQGKADEKNLAEFEELGFNLHFVTKKGENFFKNYFEIRKILKDNKFDIVHCHMSNTNFFPLLYSKVVGVKYRINHSHNAIVKKGVLKKILCQMSKWVDTNRMACSRDAAIWLFNEEKDVTILKNAMIVEKYSFNEEERIKKRRELNFDDDDIVLGCVGRLEEQKNQEFLIELMNKLNNSSNKYKLLIIGIGEDEEKIKKLVQEYNLQNVVKFLGSRNDVDKLYQAMDIFALPSLFEGLGIVFVEAQISGLQCISSTNVPYDAKISDNMFFLELDIDKWYSVIKAYKKYTRKSEVINAKNMGYDIHFEAKKLDDYYKKLIYK